MTRQLHRRLNAAQRDTIRLAKSATVKYAPPRPARTPNPLSRKEIETMPVNNPLVPLVLLALEIGEDVEQLARRLDGAVILDNIGIRVIPRDSAAAVLTEHHAEQQAERERQQAQAERRRRAAAKSREQHAQLQRRLAAIQAQQQPGLDGVDMPAAALANLTAGEHQTRVAENATTMAEYMRGGITYHRLSPQEA